jgi:hypothetical protein
MACAAKYIDLKGFLLNQLYRTLIIQLVVSSLCTFNPTKKAAGSFCSKKKEKLNGFVTNFLNVPNKGFIIV